jgi:hypothetical protein
MQSSSGSLVSEMIELRFNSGNIPPYRANSTRFFQLAGGLLQSQIE